MSTTHRDRDRAANDIEQPDRAPSRRDVLSRAAGLAGVAAATGLGLPATSGADVGGVALRLEEGPTDHPGPAAAHRRERAARIRHRCELQNRLLPVPDHPDNGDEGRYPSRIGNFSKGLPHDSLGEVDPEAYRTFLEVLAAGEEHPEGFESLALGCPDPSQQMKLINPQAGLAYDLEGLDSHQLAIPPAPAFASAEAAGEMTELYWMALLRDVHFLDFESSPLAAEAALELSALSDFRGPRVGGAVTPATLFRDELRGAKKGPYLSQLLWRPTAFGAERLDRKMRTLLPGDDHLTAYGEWLAIQNGFPPAVSARFDAERRFIRNPRDLAQWVHVDMLFQAYLGAFLVLISPYEPGDPDGLGIGAPLAAGNPYNDSLSQVGFGTFGVQHVGSLLCEVATRALKAIWFQKWFVHRRLRPEVFGGRIHNHERGAAEYPIHDDVLGCSARARIADLHGTSLLPQVFPEGSPTHPSYGAGHATVAGACVTVLKAFFDEAHEIPAPVVPTPDGRELVPWSGARLTVLGELNKLASNIATGRNMAGVHWRSDGVESLRLGEAVAVSILREQRLCFNEPFAGFTFTGFDGETITV